MHDNQEQAHATDPIEGEYLSGKEMVDLERERIRSQDKRTDITKLAI